MRPGLRRKNLRTGSMRTFSRPSVIKLRKCPPICTEMDGHFRPNRYYLINNLWLSEVVERAEEHIEVFDRCFAFYVVRDLNLFAAYSSEA